MRANYIEPIKALNHSTMLLLTILGVDASARALVLVLMSPIN